MKNPLLLSSLAGVLLVAPGLVSAQPENNPPQNNQRENNRPNPGRPGQMRPGHMQQGPEGAPMRGQGMALANLGLTDVQKADLRKARETARRDRLRKSTDLKIARMDLQSLMRADKVDEKAVAAKLAELQAAQGALTKLGVDTALAMKRIFTPEQQKKISEMRATGGRQRTMQGMRGRMQQRMKMRGRPGRGGNADQNPDFDLDLDPKASDGGAVTR